MLLKIADNCTSNLTVQQYVFTRVEEILGLGIDFADADIDVFGAKVCAYRLLPLFSAWDAGLARAKQSYFSLHLHLMILNFKKLLQTNHYTSSSASP